MLDYFIDRDNFMILNVVDSADDVVVEKLSKATGINIVALVRAHVHSETTEYVKEPREAMEALRDLGIEPSDYDNVILDI